MSQQHTSQEPRGNKKDISALLDEETQIAIMKFFLRTSVPRILKQEAEAKEKKLAEQE